MDSEETLKAGDVCVDCQQLGLVKYLRYFKLNLNGDTLLKCESNECMYPYNDDISTSSDEEPEEDVKEDLVEANSLKFIDDFLQEYAKGNGQESINSNEPTTTDQFDMSFLDNLQEVIKENHAEEGFGIENNKEFNDEIVNDKIIENQLMGIINPNENLEENKIIGGKAEEANNKNEDKMIEDQLNELLRTNEYTEKNFEVLDNKNNEILLLDSLNSTKCEITTAVIEECSDNDKETISFLTLIDNPLEDSKANETKVNELKSNIENDKQTSLPTLMEDNVKDYKPKIDIQSIETIKLETSFCNILPNTLDIKIATPETSSNNSPTTTLKTVKKTTKKSQTKAPKKHSTTKASPSSLTNELSNETNNTPTPSNTSSTSDIPKANILKGSDILKKLAIIDEKSSKMNTKLKSARTNKKLALNHPPELTPPPNPTQQKIDTDFSIDKLTEILIANKLKRENKNS